ncbi:hypothetical protein [Chroococcidiopsis sp.]|uniref:hypothetical protein n=1 Tax=Chroococcidiopsis sp. TaxID=3088168 RepID=UPI003F3D0CB8
MSYQLTIYDALPGSDKDHASLPNARSDAKKQAIQRYLNSGKTEPTICVNKYSPGRRSTQYYRLSYLWRGKKKHIHLRGGSTISELANYRALQLQALIDRGAELAEVLAMATNFNGGLSDRPKLDDH